MQENNPTRIVIVDDHPLFRDGVISRLKLEPDMAIVADYEDGAQGLIGIRKNKPDVVLLDVNLPTLNGLQIAKQMRSEGISSRIIVLTAHHDTEQTLHVIRAGAQAYAAKDIPSDKLVQIIRNIARGYYVINETPMKPPQVREWINEQIETLSETKLESGEEQYTPLSPREMEILTYVTHGKSNKEIAQALNISQQTVKNHMTSILRKLNVEDRTQAAVAAIRHGWVRIQK
jgi:DNA-binding NarL/FixJ family response regulator